MNNYQVAIIGGGLAGLTLSIQLANAGYSCILFERNTFPFHKVCGEYVSNESWNFLERLGLNLSLFDLPQINQLCVSSPSGNLFNHQLDLGGFGISRYKLDQLLYELAIQKGVVILEDCKVRDCKFKENSFSIETSKGSYSSIIAAGAWGKSSNMDAGLARKFITAIKKREENYVGIKYHVKLPFKENVIELHNFENGYCGISRVENGICCMCYLTNAENLKKYNGNIKEMEKEIVMKNPILERYFKTAHFLFDEPLAISQIRIGYKSAVENNVLMMGDAAGNIAPLSGNGMSMAMKSSVILFELIDTYMNDKLSREELNRHYQQSWKAQFEKRIKLSGYLQKLLKNKSLSNMAITVLKRIPSLRNVVIRSTHGKPF